jgi:P27 family predicted phage terminase small subunit
MRTKRFIPSKIIELRGGTAHTHKPPRDQEPQPPTKMPPCPSHLDADAKKEWRRAGKVLNGLGLLTDLDLAVFAGYCAAFSRWKQATTKVSETGMLIKASTGTPMMNPYLMIASMAFKEMLKAGGELGLSPSSRAGIRVDGPKSKSKMEKFMERKATNGQE